MVTGVDWFYAEMLQQINMIRVPVLVLLKEVSDHFMGATIQLIIQAFFSM